MRVFLGELLELVKRLNVGEKGFFRRNYTLMLECSVRYFALDNSYAPSYPISMIGKVSGAGVMPWSRRRVRVARWRTWADSSNPAIFWSIGYTERGTRSPIRPSVSTAAQRT